jgi:hypothetical protein
MNNFELISMDPAQMGGVPCVRYLGDSGRDVTPITSGRFVGKRHLGRNIRIRSRKTSANYLHFAAGSGMERERPVPPEGQ